MIKLNVKDSRQHNISPENAKAKIVKVLEEDYSFLALNFLIISNYEDDWLVMENNLKVDCFFVFKYMEQVADYLYHQNVRAEDLVSVRRDHIKIDIQIELV